MPFFAFLVVAPTAPPPKGGTFLIANPCLWYGVQEKSEETQIICKNGRYFCGQRKRGR